ncbi:unnamed protein product [marine sediment metagenome]|uniref:Uncharacterized protein n=1 Tax=marine sediment metagenome TaxID=412755 RepID=X1SV18_9ZZZZ
MKLKYNRNSELEIAGFGLFKPGAIVEVDDETEAKRYLDSSYFDEVKKRKKIVKVKKYKTKEVNKNATRK